MKKHEFKGIYWEQLDQLNRDIKIQMIGLVVSSLLLITGVLIAIAKG